jgi:hypothetical protein
MFGVLRSLDDDRVSVELAPGVVVEVLRGAIGQHVPSAEGPVESVDEESDDTPTTTDQTAPEER